MRAATANETKLRVQVSLSLDGFVAGPDQSVQNPLGIGGLRLHQLVFGLRAWRAAHGMDGGEENASTEVVTEIQANIGAVIMGRNMFGGQPGPWNPAQPWNGWWGDAPPFHCPVFVLTHHPRPPLQAGGGTTFTFVTAGADAALAQARQAAGARDISVAGGARTVQQFVAAGLIDEMWLHLVPVLLGRGERLFEGIDDLRDLALVRTVAAPTVTHLKLAR